MARSTHPVILERIAELIGYLNTPIPDATLSALYRQDAWRYEIGVTMCLRQEKSHVARAGSTSPVGRYEKRFINYTGVLRRVPGYGLLPYNRDLISANTPEDRENVEAIAAFWERRRELGIDHEAARDHAAPPPFTPSLEQTLKTLEAARGHERADVALLWRRVSRDLRCCPHCAQFFLAKHDNAAFCSRPCMLATHPTDRDAWNAYMRAYRRHPMRDDRHRARHQE